MHPLDALGSEPGDLLRVRYERQPAGRPLGTQIGRPPPRQWRKSVRL